MTNPTEAGRSRRSADAVARVDPRTPRFGQAVTASGLLSGIALDRPVLVFAVTAVLSLAVLSRWRVDAYGLAFRGLVAPRLAPEAPEPAAPHRFAKLIGAAGTTLASLALLAGVPLVGYALAGAVALAAGLAATTGLCLGCRMYRGVALFRRHDLV